MHRRHRLTALNLVLGWAALLIALALPGTGTIPVTARADEANRFGYPALQATSTPRRGTPTATYLPVFPVITSTPNTDGSVSHEVQPGQTLIGIAEAYGLTITDLLTLNNLQSNAVIFPGNKLVVVPVVTPSVTPTTTNTARPTAMPTATRRPATSTPAQTQVPTITPTAIATPWFRLPQVDMNARSMGLVLIVVCAIGLVVVGVTGFRSK